MKQRDRQGVGAGGGVEGRGGGKRQRHAQSGEEERGLVPRVGGERQRQNLKLSKIFSQIFTVCRVFYPPKSASVRRIKRQPPPPPRPLPALPCPCSSLSFLGAGVRHPF